MEKNQHRSFHIQYAFTFIQNTTTNKKNNINKKKPMYNKIIIADLLNTYFPS